MKYRRLALSAFLFAIAFGIPRLAAAGGMPWPLEVDLDLVKSVVVGRIVNVSAISVEGYVETGLATVDVSETLKGPSAKTLEFTCATKVLPVYDGSAIIRSYHCGDSGIWVVYADGHVSDFYGLLPENRKSDVKSKLQQLATRKWSEPVNGLRAWAAAVRPGYVDNHPVIVFAVQNITDNDIFVPSAALPGFVTATMTAGKTKSRRSFTSGDSVKMPTYCQKLAPGEITYLHPESSFIDPARRLKLSDGQYSVVVTCENTREQGTLTGPGSNVSSVTAWTGKPSAPAAQLILRPEAPADGAGSSGAPWLGKVLPSFPHQP